MDDLLAQVEEPFDVQLLDGRLLRRCRLVGREPGGLVLAGASGVTRVPLDAVRYARLPWGDADLEVWGNALRERPADS